jgi:hypothetical protein
MNHKIPPTKSIIKPKLTNDKEPTTTTGTEALNTISVIGTIPKAFVSVTTSVIHTPTWNLVCFNNSKSGLIWVHLLVLFFICAGINNNISTPSL